MTCRKNIIFAFIFIRKTTYAAEFTQGIESVFPAGQQFMRICLVADIPDDLIFGRVQAIVNRHYQLNCAQAGRQMPARRRHCINDSASYFMRQKRKVIEAEFF